MDCMPRQAGRAAVLTHFWIRRLRVLVEEKLTADANPAMMDIALSDSRSNA